MAVRMGTTTTTGAEQQHHPPVRGHQSARYLLMTLVLILGAVIPNISKSMSTRTTTSSSSSTTTTTDYHMDEEEFNGPSRAWFATAKSEEEEEQQQQRVTTVVTPVKDPSEDTAGVTNKLQQGIVALKTVVLEHLLANTTVGADGTIPATDKGKSSIDDTHDTKASRKKPLNILILYPDDWRHDTIGKENSIVQTPFLDSLADRGIRFRQNAVTCSICWVSRATLFTGQWPSRHQSKKLICPHFAAGYLWKEASWPAILQKQGYYIGHVVRISKDTK
jgi:hypothetical protein